MNWLFRIHISEDERNFELEILQLDAWIIKIVVKRRIFFLFYILKSTK